MDKRITAEADMIIFYSIVQTADGGYAAAGYSGSSDGDFVIAKFDENGDKEWMRSYSGGYGSFSSIVQTADGGYAAAGASRSYYGDLSGNNRYGDFVIAKFDENGDKTWIKNYGESSSDDYFSSIVQTADGGCAAVGESQSYDGDLSGNNGYGDFVIAKFDENGDKTWIKNYGRSSNDHFYSIVQTVDGGYAAVGGSSSSDCDLSGNEGSTDFVIVKFDENGNRN